MFAAIEGSRKSRWRLVSLAGHLAVVGLIWLGRPQPPLLQPHATAAGNALRDYRLVYLGSTGEDALGSSEVEPSDVRLKAPVAAVRKPRVAQQQEPRKDAEMSDRTATAGSRFGSLDNGPSDGRDVRPAYPVVFPDPPIPHWLASSVAGDVIVEVTIDQQGNVTDLRLLQGVREDINEKVITTLLNWKFNPASIDGTKVVSREDMHFHFPA